MLSCLFFFVCWQINIWRRIKCFSPNWNIWDFFLTQHFRTSILNAFFWIEMKCGNYKRLPQRRNTDNFFFCMSATQSFCLLNLGGQKETENPGALIYTLIIKVYPPETTPRSQFCIALKFTAITFSVFTELCTPLALKETLKPQVYITAPERI